MKIEILLLVVSCSTYCIAQNHRSFNQRKCNDETEECVQLTRCPPILKKAVSPLAVVRREIGAFVCKLVDKRIHVCCQKTNPTKPIGTRLVTFGENTKANVNLLPTKCGQPATDDRIFGGTRAPIGAYPWMAAIGYKFNKGKTINFECAGSLISSRYVLTAAHCLNPSDIPGLELSVIHLGDWNIGNPGIDCEDTRLGDRCASGPHLEVGFDEVVIHEDYNQRFKTSDDIALVRLDRDVNFEASKTLMAPICLPPEDFDPATVTDRGDPIAAGWGFTEHGNKSDVLLRVEIPFQTQQKCSEIYKERFSDKQICAGGLLGFDSCGGDSGGPLILSGPHGPPFMQVGIVSFGPRRCGQDDFPAVYTSVAKYRKWIQSNMKP